MNWPTKLIATGFLTATAFAGMPAAAGLAAPRCGQAVQVNPQPESVGGPAIAVSARRSLQETTIDQVRVNIEARGGQSTSRILYSAPAGCFIDSSRLPFGDVDFRSLTHHSMPAGDSASFVAGYRVLVSKPGVQVLFKPFTVYLIG